MHVVFRDLPAGSTITIDGVPLQLPPDRAPPAMVGVRQLPEDESFHLITLRCGDTTRFLHGFVIVPRHQGEDIVLRYDEQMEEVGGELMDPRTRTNVLSTIADAEQRFATGSTSDQITLFLAALPKYSELMERKGDRTKDNMVSWKQLTAYITPSLLKIRGLVSLGESCNCVKVVPGIVPDDGDAANNSMQATPATTTDDAVSIQYPPVPVFPTHETSFRALSHEGTKSFLRSLPPGERTDFMLRARTGDTANDLALEYLLKSITNDNLLADVQLSFIFFWQLQCYASLTHWRDLTALVGSCTSAHQTLQQQVAEQLALQLRGQQGDNTEAILLDEYQDSALVASWHRLGRQHAGLRRVLLQQGMVPVVDDEGDDTNDGASRCTHQIDDDTPVMVPPEHVARLSGSSPLPIPSISTQDYPLLAAAMLEHEDVLMTCARALDTAGDAGLVREAAAYLEQVEATTNQST